MFSGSTVYSCSDRGDSSGANVVMCMVTGWRSTSARAVTISHTYRPLTVPARAISSSRHKVRNATLVTPAMGASTTGLCNAIDPICSADRAGSRAVRLTKKKTRRAGSSFPASRPSCARARGDAPWRPRTCRRRPRALRRAGRGRRAGARPHR
ncbi:cytospin-A, putative [Mycolicibacterium smegmatis MC2 155]|uniref:Cytospin-A, putative n=1 Tax=Mycolicibacterium smegmatis (strain ATCC 700084 / mc(2)155) TaxID=246196 RepID=A0R4B4_MYCS2|nr:cytospin-A, putative [Mycolicibacterium smegmatis MC2 155]